MVVNLVAQLKPCVLIIWYCCSYKKGVGHENGFVLYVCGDVCVRNFTIGETCCDFSWLSLSPCCCVVCKRYGLSQFRLQAYNMLVSIKDVRLMFETTLLRCM